jgi:type I restriction enzyme, S subunit
MANKTWRKLSLGEVIMLQRGYDLPHRDRKHGTIPIISSSGNIDTHNEARATGPGVVTGRYGTIGEVFFISEDFWPLNTTLFVRDFKGNNPLFISFLLRTIDYQSYSGKSGVPGVNRNDLHEINVSLPPLHEQHAIATALSDVDALIASLNKLIAKKRDIKQATMQQLLTGKTRLPGFSKGLKPVYKQTEVGMIPKDWEVKSIGDVITDFRGGAPLTPDDFRRDGVKVLPKGGVARGGKLKIAENEQQYCSQKYAEAHTSNQVNNLYTIVVLRDLVPSGPSIGLMIKIEDPDAFVLAQGVYGFKVSQNKTDPEYLIQFSNGFPYRKLMNSIMVGSTQVHITNTALKKVLLPFPSLPEQQAIATILSDMDAEIAALEQKREKTRMLKQGMMQELLTGKTRLL